MASLVVYMFVMVQASHLFLRGGGGGRAKTEKEIMRKKKGEKFTSTQRSMVKKFMQVPPIFGICITGMLETEVLYF